MNLNRWENFSLARLWHGYCFQTDLTDLIIKYLTQVLFITVVCRKAALDAQHIKPHVGWATTVEAQHWVPLLSVKF